MRLSAVYLTLLLSITQLSIMAGFPCLSQADPIANSGARNTAIYRPTHRTPEQLIATLKPLFAERARFSTDGTHVLIDTDATTGAEVAELLPALDHPPRRFNIELSNQAPISAAKIYATSTRTISQHRFAVTEDETITLLKERQIQTVSGLMPLWREISTQPTQQEFIQLRLHAAETEFYLSVLIQTLNNGSLTMISNKVSGEFDQWIPLTGGAQQEATDSTTTNLRREGQLYIKITAQ